MFSCRLASAYLTYLSWLRGVQIAARRLQRQKEELARATAEREAAVAANAARLLEIRKAKAAALGDAGAGQRRLEARQRELQGVCVCTRNPLCCFTPYNPDGTGVCVCARVQSAQPPAKRRSPQTLRPLQPRAKPGLPSWATLRSVCVAPGRKQRCKRCSHSPFVCARVCGLQAGERRLQERKRQLAEATAAREARVAANAARVRDQRVGRAAALGDEKAGQRRLAARQQSLAGVFTCACTRQGRCMHTSSLLVGVVCSQNKQLHVKQRQLKPVPLPSPSESAPRSGTTNRCVVS